MSVLFWSLAGLIVVTLIFAVKIVPQSENHLIERFGRYERTLHAGINLVVPFLERIPPDGRISIVETQLPMIKISAITLDNVTIHLDLAILYRVVDAARRKYRIQNLEQAIRTTVVGTVRSVIGKTDLDGVQSNRRDLSEAIEQELTPVSEEWGIVLSRVEIIDVEVDDETKSAMALQLNAERSRRALVREAEGKKEATMLEADANLYQAEKQAEATKLLADAQAYAVSAVSEAIRSGGESAVAFEVKKIQADAIKSLGQSEGSKLVMMPVELLEGLTNVTKRIGGK